MVVDKKNNKKLSFSRFLFKVSYTIICKNVLFNQFISRSMLTLKSTQFLSLARKNQPLIKITLQNLCEHLFENPRVLQQEISIKVFLDRKTNKMIGITKSSTLNPLWTESKSNENFKFFIDSNLIGNPTAGKIFDQVFFDDFPLKLMQGFVFFLTECTIPATGFLKLTILESLFPKIQLRKGECFNFFLLAVKESNKKNLDLFDIIIIEEPKTIGNFQFLSELSMTYSFMLWENPILNKKVSLNTITFCHNSKNILKLNNELSQNQTGQVNCDLILNFLVIQTKRELNLFCDLKQGRVGEFNFNKRLLKEILIFNNQEIETLPKNPDLSKFIKNFVVRKKALFDAIKGSLTDNENPFFKEVDQILTSSENLFEQNKKLQQIFIFYSNEERLREICCNSLYFEKNINNTTANLITNENKVEIKDDFYFDNKEMCNVTKKIYTNTTSREKIKEFILNNTNKQWKGSLLENIVDL